MVKLGLIKDAIANDRWRITPKGQAALQSFKKKCGDGVVDVRFGFLWTPKFKKILKADFVPSEIDAEGPVGPIYKETQILAMVESHLLLLEELKPAQEPL